MNNLGGFSTVELLFLDEVVDFSVFSGGASVTRAATTSRMLPVLYGGSSISAASKYGNSGTIYTHKAVLKLRNKRVDAKLEAELRGVNSRGCILIATDSNGICKIYGSKDYPLLGTLDEVPGTGKSNLHHFQLNLSATALHPAYLAI